MSRWDNMDACTSIDTMPVSTYFSAARHNAQTSHSSPYSVLNHDSRDTIDMADTSCDNKFQQAKIYQCRGPPYEKPSSLANVEALLYQATLLSDKQSDPVTQARQLLNEWASQTHEVSGSDQDYIDDGYNDEFEDTDMGGDDLSQRVLRCIQASSDGFGTTAESLGWMDNPKKDRIGNGLSMTGSAVNTKEYVCNIVKEAVQHKTPKSSSSRNHQEFTAFRNPQLSITARQDLVKERKRLMDMKRHDEIQQKLALKQQQLQHALELQHQAARKAIVDKEVVSRMQREHQIHRNLDHAITEMDHIHQAQITLMDESINHDAELAIKEAKKKIIAEKHCDAIVSKRIDTMIAKRNMRLMRTLSKKRILSEWKRMRETITEYIVVINTKQAWRIQVTSFSRWINTYKSQCAKRHQRALRESLAHQQQLVCKAVRFDRSRCLSKAFLAFKLGTELYREDRRMQEIHIQRAVQMQQFLAQLNKRHQQNTSSIDNSQPSNKICLYHEHRHDTVADITRDRTNKVDSSELGAAALPIVSSQNDAILACGRVNRPPKPIKRIQMDTRFIQAMEKRQAERDQRRNEASIKLAEQKQKKELEKARIEQERQDQEEKERHQMIQLKKQAEHESRQKLEQIEASRQKIQKQYQHAKKHHIQSIQAFYGLKPWQKYIQVIRQQEKEAAMHYNRMLQQQVMWRLVHRMGERIAKREQRAVQMYHTHSKRSILHRWIQAKNQVFNMKAKAVQRSQQCAQKVMLTRWIAAWRKAVIKHNMEQVRLCQIADGMAKRVVPRRVLYRWQEFVQEQKDERWRVYRRSQLQARVQSILQESGRLEKAIKTIVMDIKPIER
ncbi:hypothetical protein BDV3_005350 [Batrachochytrium dendrobatidis]